jgi:hypothetical protein
MTKDPTERTNGTDTVRPAEHRENSPMMASGSIAEITERLFAEFAPRVSLTTIVAAVRQGRRDLDGTPESALPEMVERLARQRLTELAQHPPTPT